jgi:hypothetical protein
MAALAALVVMAPATPSAAQSFFPPTAVAEFLVNYLDLSTIRSSLGPRRSISKRTFASLGIVPTHVEPDEAVLDSNEWYYSLRVFRRADINGDGLEDLEVCFTDHAKAGTYSSQQSLLVTRYAATGYAVALKYEVSGCEAFLG